MYTTPPSPGSHRQGFIVHPRTSLGLVSLGRPSDAQGALTRFESVKVWDAVGEEKVSKGEYKVLAGKMYVISL
jgi:hypothetical protein